MFPCISYSLKISWKHFVHFYSRQKRGKLIFFQAGSVTAMSSQVVPGSFELDIDDDDDDIDDASERQLMDRDVFRVMIVFVVGVSAVAFLAIFMIVLFAFPSITALNFFLH
jgi:hypothetical protein